MEFNDIKKYATILFTKDYANFEAGNVYTVHDVSVYENRSNYLYLEYEDPYYESDYCTESISEEEFIEYGCRVVDSVEQSVVDEFDALVRETHEAAKKANEIRGGFPEVIVLDEFRQAAQWHSSRC